MPAALPMKSFRAVLVLALLAVGSVARAQGEPDVVYPVYVAARYGRFSPLSEWGPHEMKGDLAAEVAVGWRALPHVAVELGVGYYHQHGEEGITSIVPPFVGTHWSYDLAMKPITATAKFMLPLGLVDLYALTGVGLYMARLAQETTQTDGFRDHLYESDNAFGFHFGVGLSLNIMDRASVGCELRDLVVSPRLWGQPVENDGIQVTATASFRFPGVPDRQ